MKSEFSGISVFGRKQIFTILDIDEGLFTNIRINLGIFKTLIFANVCEYFANFVVREYSQIIHVMI